MTDLSPFPPPPSILIVGAGVFGLSTALHLLRSGHYTSTHLCILDGRTSIPTSKAQLSEQKQQQQQQPPAHAQTTASLDSSRLVRTDYASGFYARLGAQALRCWRGDDLFRSWYRESGIVLVWDGEEEVNEEEGMGMGMGRGEGYVRASMANVLKMEMDTEAEDSLILGQAVKELHSTADVCEIMATGGSSGSNGYLNSRSGWADATAAMEAVRSEVYKLGLEHPGGVSWISGHARSLIVEDTAQGRRVSGVRYSHTAVSAVSASNPTVTDASNGIETLHAALTILATGAWTPALVPSAPIEATAQTMAYIQLQAHEHAALASIPVLLNLSSGYFLVPPTPDGMLKIAHHSHGWRNPILVPDLEAIDAVSEAATEDPQSRTSDAATVEISVPAATFDSLPPSSVAGLQAFTRAMIPGVTARLDAEAESAFFTATRVCWYADTPDSDFLVDFHPRYGKSLFLATGGSGHAFKFLPVLGEKVLQVLLAGGARLAGEGLEGWAWRGEGGGAWTDGSRGVGGGVWDLEAW